VSNRSETARRAAMPSSSSFAVTKVPAAAACLAANSRSTEIFARARATRYLQPPTGSARETRRPPKCMEATGRAKLHRTNLRGLSQGLEQQTKALRLSRALRTCLRARACAFGRERLGHARRPPGRAGESCSSEVLKPRARRRLVSIASEPSCSTRVRPERICVPNESLLCQLHGRSPGCRSDWLTPLPVS
jgi:hypothetical protein